MAGDDDFGGGLGGPQRQVPPGQTQQAPPEQMRPPAGSEEFGGGMGRQVPQEQMMPPERPLTAQEISDEMRIESLIQHQFNFRALKIASQQMEKTIGAALNRSGTSLEPVELTPSGGGKARMGFVGTEGDLNRMKQTLEQAGVRVEETHIPDSNGAPGGKRVLTIGEKNSPKLKLEIKNLVEMVQGKPATPLTGDVKIGLPRNIPETPLTTPASDVSFQQMENVKGRARMRVDLGAVDATSGAATQEQLALAGDIKAHLKGRGVEIKGARKGPNEGVVIENGRTYVEIKNGSLDTFNNMHADAVHAAELETKFKAAGLKTDAPVKAGTTQAGTAQAGTTQAGTTQAGTAQAGAAQAGTTQAGAATQTGSTTTQTGTTQAGTAQAGAARTAEQLLADVAKANKKGLFQKSPLKIALKADPELAELVASAEASTKIKGKFGVKSPNAGGGAKFTGVGAMIMGVNEFNAAYKSGDVGHMVLGAANTTVGTAILVSSTKSVSGIAPVVTSTAGAIARKAVPWVAAAAVVYDTITEHGTNDSDAVEFKAKRFAVGAGSIGLGIGATAVATTATVSIIGAMTAGAATGAVVGGTAGTVALPVVGTVAIGAVGAVVGAAVGLIVGVTAAVVGSMAIDNEKQGRIDARDQAKQQEAKKEYERKKAEFVSAVKTLSKTGSDTLSDADFYEQGSQHLEKRTFAGKDGKIGQEELDLLQKKLKALDLVIEVTKHPAFTPLREEMKAMIAEVKVGLEHAKSEFIHDPGKVAIGERIGINTNEIAHGTLTPSGSETPGSAVYNGDKNRALQGGLPLVASRDPGPAPQGTLISSAVHVGNEPQRRQVVGVGQAANERALM